jgi:hypothetical protein
MEAYEHGTEVERQDTGMTRCSGKKKKSVTSSNTNPTLAAMGQKILPTSTSFMNMWFASLT